MNKPKWIDLSKAILLGFGTVGVLLIALFVAENTMSEQLDPNTTYEGLEGSSNDGVIFRGTGYDCSRKGVYSVTSLLFTLTGDKSFIDDIWVDRKAFAISNLFNKQRGYYDSSEVFPMFMEISVPCTNIVVNRTYASYKDFPEDDDCIDDEGRYCFVKYRRVYTDWNGISYIGGNNSYSTGLSLNQSAWRIK